VAAQAATSALSTPATLIRICQALAMFLIDHQRSPKRR